MAPAPRLERLTAPPLQLTLHWRCDQIARIDLNWLDSSAPDADLTPPTQLSDLAQALAASLARYVAGAFPTWPELPFASDAVTPFAWRVLMRLKDVPPGQTLTYGALAALCDHPKAARAIGRIMAANPWPLIIPCHRVLGAGGKLTGYSAGAGLELKAYLLRVEGAAFKEEQLI
jgi:methylated-DNA-[protein]-cysteine S-methyltransferase